MMPGETIGYCEKCGVVDHHLIHDLCHTCLATTITLPDRGETPLGVEAADLSAIPGFDNREVN